MVDDNEILIEPTFDEKMETIRERAIKIVGKVTTQR